VPRRAPEPIASSSSNRWCPHTAIRVGCVDEFETASTIWGDVTLTRSVFFESGREPQSRGHFSPYLVDAGESM